MKFTVKSFFRKMIPLVLFSFLVIYGQNCSESTYLKFISYSSTDTTDGGNGGVYDGKLLFSAYEFDFTCEGIISPKANTSIQYPILELMSC